jgi:hypothetical protein
VGILAGFTDTGNSHSAPTVLGHPPESIVVMGFEPSAVAKAGRVAKAWDQHTAAVNRPLANCRVCFRISGIPSLRGA